MSNLADPLVLPTTPFRSQLEIATDNYRVDIHKSLDVMVASVNAACDRYLGVPQTLADMLAERRATILESYAKKDDKEKCGLVALSIAGKFWFDGEDFPRVAFIKAKSINGKPRTLHPARFNGDVEWSHHAACTVNGIVYDPLSDRPRPVEAFLEREFLEPAEVDFYSIPFASQAYEYERPRLN